MGDMKSLSFGTRNATIPHVHYKGRMEGFHPNSHKQSAGLSVYPRGGFLVGAKQARTPGMRRMSRRALASVSTNKLANINNLNRMGVS